MGELSHGTWVLVADGEKALFLENVTDHQNPNLQVRHEEHHENPSNYDQKSDAAGRRSDGMSQMRSAVSEADWHQLEKDRFADELAQMIYKRVHRGQFKRIVLVAPPKTLGELRAKLHVEALACVIGEIDKTLTNHPLDQIERIVKEEMDASA
ncbi:MAG: host attachment protein [Boseongicola sp.]|nr:host attachment protein [Boseongicola sp.]